MGFSLIPRGKLLGCIPLRPKRRKAPADENIQLDQGARGGLAPTSAVNALERELAEERAKYQRVKAEADASAEVRRKLEGEVQEAKELSVAREKDAGHKDVRIRQLEKDVNEMQKKLAGPQTADPRVQELSTRLAEKDKLLTERTMELNAAQAFLTKVDAVSEAEVVGMIENLNTLISSASGALSDTWDSREPIPGALVEDPGLKQIRDYFGNSMVEQIDARNSVAVTLAIQMCLGYFIEGVTSGWGGGEVAVGLGEIYGMISAKEGQTIASRWRTLTKRYAPHQEPPRVEEIMGDLARILMITGSFSDYSEAMESAGSSAETEVKTIMEATLQLDNTIKTKIASSDMFVYIVQPGDVFAEEMMEDEFGEGGKREGGEPRIVAGTMEIGLLQRTGNVEKVLRKPKVILERDLVEPEG